jgi:hypothetical protein
MSSGRRLSSGIVEGYSSIKFRCGSIDSVRQLVAAVREIEVDAIVDELDLSRNARRPDSPEEWKVSIDWSVAAAREPGSPDPRPTLEFSRALAGVIDTVESCGVPATITSLHLELRGKTRSGSEPPAYPDSSVTVQLTADADPAKLVQAFHDPKSTLFSATAS